MLINAYPISCFLDATRIFSAVFSERRLFAAHACAVIQRKLLREATVLFFSKTHVNRLISSVFWGEGQRSGAISSEAYFSEETCIQFGCDQRCFRSSRDQVGYIVWVVARLMGLSAQCAERCLLFTRRDWASSDFSEREGTRSSFALVTGERSLVCFAVLF